MPPIAPAGPRVSWQKTWKLGPPEVPGAHVREPDSVESSRFRFPQSKDSRRMDTCDAVGGHGHCRTVLYSRPRSQLGWVFPATKRRGSEALETRRTSVARPCGIAGAHGAAGLPGHRGRLQLEHAEYGKNRSKGRIMNLFDPESSLECDALVHTGSAHMVLYVRDMLREASISDERARATLGRSGLDD